MSDDRLIQDFLGTVVPLFPNGSEINGTEPVDQGSYSEYPFKEADELLKALDCESSIYQRGETASRRRFAFRGQRVSRWRLEPSIFRESLAQRDFENSVTGDRKDRYLRHQSLNNQYELVPFVNFLDGMDRLGLFLEPECQQLLQAYKVAQEQETGAFVEFLAYIESKERFPTQEQFRSLALAQHFGVPTRLLDWTTNPYIALFFATEGIYDELPEDQSRFAVWLVPQILLRAAQIFKGLDLVDAAKIDNKNIVAQHGFFTSHIPPRVNERGDHIDWPKIPDKYRFPYLDEYLMDAGGIEGYEDFLGKFEGKPLCFTLGADKVAPIRRKLDQLNINWSTMMPNLEGVLKETKRRTALHVGYKGI